MTIEVGMQPVDALSDVALSSAGEAARRGRYIQTSGLKWLGRTLGSSHYLAKTHAMSTL